MIFFPHIGPLVLDLFMHPVIKNCRETTKSLFAKGNKHSKNTKSDCLNPSNWNNRLKVNWKSLGILTKAQSRQWSYPSSSTKPIQSALSSAQTGQGGGDRKHLIKSKLIFQQFELTELRYNGSRRRIAPESLTARKMSSQCFTWRPWELFKPFFISKSSLITRHILRDWRLSEKSIY